MAEGITEIWNITWVCLTVANPDCARMHDRVHGVPPFDTPWKYFSEYQCVSYAESIAEELWNEKRIKLEYYCDHVRTYEPFVPARRYRPSTTAPSG